MAVRVWVILLFVPMLCVYNVTADASCHLHESWLFSSLVKVMISNIMRANILSLTQATGILQFCMTVAQGARLNLFTSKVFCVMQIITSVSVYFASPMSMLPCLLCIRPAESEKWKGQDVWVGSMHLGTNKQSILLHLLRGGPLRHGSQSWFLCEPHWRH